MADTDPVVVSIVSKIDQLQSGLTEAVSAMREAVSAMTEQMHSLEESSKHEESVLDQLLSTERFIAWKEGVEGAFEAAHKAFETLESAYEGTVGSAMEFGLQNEKIASVMGTTVERAAGLDAALKNVGSSTDAYESIALRLQKTLESAGGPSKELKDQFKDANGQFLSGAALMDRLAEVTNSYSEGAARTSVEVALLGRQTKSYYDIARATGEMQERQTAIYKQMGVDIAGAGAKSRELEDAVGDLRTAWSAEAVVIGQDLLPIAKSAIGWMGGDGKALIGSLEVGVKGLITGFMALKTFVADAAIVMSAGLATVWDQLKEGGTILSDIVHGRFSSIAADAKKSGQEIGDDVRAMFRSLESEQKDFDKGMSALWDKAKPPEVGEAQKGGGKSAPANLMGGGHKGPKDTSADEETHSEEKVAVERVKLNEEANQHLLSMGRETLDDYLASARVHADQEYQIKLASLNRELELTGRTKSQRQKTLDEIMELEQAHVGALQKITEQGQTQRAALEKQDLASYLQQENERLTVGTSALGQLYERHQITSDQKAALERQLTETIKREELARLDAAIAALVPGTKAYEAALQERARLEMKFTADVQKINETHYKETQAAAEKAITPITGAFTKSFNDMALHGKSFVDGMNGLFSDLLDHFVSVLEQMLTQWIVTQVTGNTVASTTAATAGTAQIGTAAGVAGANAAASQAGIPIVGPALAAAAAAAMIGLVLGFKSLAHAEGGMMVDENQLAFLHRNEMVLPAPLAKGVQQIIASGGSGRVGSGGFQLHYNPIFNTQPERDLYDLIREQPGALQAAIVQLDRDGKLTRRG